MRKNLSATLAVAVVIMLMLTATSRPARASEATGCAEVCADVCKAALVDSCQDFVCPEVPACPEIPACPACPDVNPRKYCPSAESIYYTFTSHQFARKYNICKVKNNGKRTCKKWYLVDNSRDGE